MDQDRALLGLVETGKPLEERSMHHALQSDLQGLVNRRRVPVLGPPRRLLQSPRLRIRIENAADLLQQCLLAVPHVARGRAEIAGDLTQRRAMLRFRNEQPIVDQPLDQLLPIRPGPLGRTPRGRRGAKGRDIHVAQPLTDGRAIRRIAACRQVGPASDELVLMLAQRPNRRRSAR